MFAAGGEPVREMLVLGATLFERILGFKTPVVVACPGHAIAAGAFLPLAADARICVDGPVPDRAERGEDRADGPVVRDRARAPAPHAPGFRPRRRQRARVHARPRRSPPASSTGWSRPQDLHAAALETAAGLAELNAEAHAATKLRVRKGALEAIRLAIETELLGEQVTAGLTAPMTFRPRRGL